MMDIKLLHLGGPGELAWGGKRALSFQKTEKIKRTVPILKSNSTLFSYNFFFTMDIKIFLKGPEVGLIFFLHITILFHQCNDKNIIYQQFYCCLRYTFYT